MKYYVYIVVCKNDSYYVGYTKNIRRRINQHNGIGFWPGSKYTRSRRPVFLQHIESFSTREKAMAREIEIKKMNTQKKHDLVKFTTKEQILMAI